MLRNCLYVMLGGAIGALLRYCVSQLFSDVRFFSMPVGTFLVNIVGCFALGLLTGIGETRGAQPYMLMLTVGVCGAFTTFSTFSGETIKAAEAGHALQAAVYVALSIAVGFLLFWTGKHLVTA